VVADFWTAEGLELGTALRTGFWADEGLEDGDFEADNADAFEVGTFEIDRLEAAVEVVEGAGFCDGLLAGKEFLESLIIPHLLLQVLR